MIQESPEELLALIREHAPDPRKPVPLMREDVSAFYEEMQEDVVNEGAHKAGKVMITDAVSGSWITLPDTGRDRVILFFHGGGFTTGSTDDHLGLCIRLARAAKAPVFSVDYRLSPEHAFPAPVQDALAAYRYLLSNGYPPHRILPVGISAGGTLVLSLLLSIRDEGRPMPLAGVCMSPVVDLLFPGESVTKNSDRDWITPARLQSIQKMYLAGQDPHDPMASPVHARMKGLPRLYIQMGTHELLLSDIGKFVDKARWAGVPVQAEIWEGMFHCWQIFASQIPEGKEAIEQAGAFIQSILAR
ncbi:alpha/beta hydrolase [uncultured Methanoregula sp.]|uniref:alpha/beta hydrolase n=1 Tax=uncultured Methanoregula sp. TaxID=1005933 RepID=UPI002AAAB327|nr:alpha/beta hydrolase [uncultured Methanoregula sp.]